MLHIVVPLAIAKTAKKMLSSLFPRFMSALKVKLYLNPERLDVAGMRHGFLWYVALELFCWRFSPFSRYKLSNSFHSAFVPITIHWKRPNMHLVFCNDISSINLPVRGAKTPYVSTAAHSCEVHSYASNKVSCKATSAPTKTLNDLSVQHLLVLTDADREIIFSLARRRAMYTSRLSFVKLPLKSKGDAGG